MTYDFSSIVDYSDAAAFSDHAVADMMGLAASHMDVRPDTYELVTVYGDVDALAALNHPQGDNILGFRGTCGLDVCSEVLNSFGIRASENEVVCNAYSKNLCDVGGGSSPLQEARILTDSNLPAHPEAGKTIGDLAQLVSDGHGVIAGVNAELLWNDPTSYTPGMGADHAVFVTGVAADPVTGQVEGFYINDPRCLEGDSGRFVSAEEMALIWQDQGGLCVVTDTVH